MKQNIFYFNDTSAKGPRGAVDLQADGAASAAVARAGWPALTASTRAPAAFV